MIITRRIRGKISPFCQILLLLIIFIIYYYDTVHYRTEFVNELVPTLTLKYSVVIHLLK